MEIPGGNASSAMIMSPWFPVTPVVGHENDILQYNKTNSLDDKNWPPLIEIMELDNDGGGSPADASQYQVHSPDSSPVMEKEVAVEPKCARNQDKKMQKVLDQATHISRKRNLEGNSGSSKNSFSVLSDKEIMLRASHMGVEIPDNDFESIDVLRSLEDARNNLKAKNNIRKHENDSYVVDNDMGAKIPLQLEWHGQGVSDTETYTVVESRKTKRQRRKSVVVARPCTRGQAKSRIPHEPPSRNPRNRQLPERFR